MKLAAQRITGAEDKAQNTAAPGVEYPPARDQSVSPSALQLAQHPACVYPPGACEANWFGLFNALSWQITLGTPIILYAKSQGASATVLGVIAALTPLLAVLQLPTAKHLPRFGYRRFILAGWGSRTLFIFAIAVVPLLWFTSAPVKVLLVLACLFAFNLLRGITAGAWMPWISELIPENMRGRFLSRDQVFSQIGSVAALSVAATALGRHPQPYQFSLVFLFSAIAQTVSLFFLTRMPDAMPPERVSKSGHRVPWATMLTWPPFLRLIIFNLLYVFVTAGLGVFTVTYLRGDADYHESRILWLSLLSFAGALATVPWLGRFLDRTGSKPVLRACLVMLGIALLGWFLVASRAIGHGPVIIGTLNLLLGIAGANFGVANARLAMATMPLMGRNHFCALYTVITSLASGLTPILWGIALDVIGHRQAIHATISWNRYSIYFACALATLLVTAVYAHWVHEDQRPTAMVGPALPAEATR